ncbi:MAG TPA: Imm10 family immunity protein [Pyrinomonadaceae bacterium]|nr:Imm10 family immunity protein [Pyrinomonadaceae bacterium]
MATVLQYNFVASSEENGVLTVGFADAQFDTQEYLLFQRIVDWEEFRSDDDDEVYVERDGQQYGTYGGIEKFVLSRNDALLLLIAETAEALDTEQEVSIAFSATDEQFEKLKTDFGRVFAGEVDFELS